tara:strand:- start:84 stop:1109 length:1026 start_codon:yes stop_codon:yes gene_type:complete
MTTNNSYKKIILFGYSVLFKNIIKICNETSITSLIIFSERQENNINALDIDPIKTSLIKANSLDNNFLKEEIMENYTLGISIGSPYIFTNENIRLFSGNLINSHGAPLPSFKGGGGFSWRILQGDRRGSSLIHLISDKIDEGEIIFKKNFFFDNAERIPIDFERRQLKEDKKHILNHIEKIIKGKISINDRNNIELERNNLETYFPRLKTDFHALIDWQLNIDDLEKFILAFSHPYSGAFTKYKQIKISIFDLKIISKEYIHPFIYGLILFTDEYEVIVAVNGGIVSFKQCDIEKSNPEIIIKAGERLYSNYQDLIEVKSSRVFFNPKGYKLINYNVEEKS